MFWWIQELQLPRKFYKFCAIPSHSKTLESRKLANILVIHFIWFIIKTIEHTVWYESGYFKKCNFLPHNTILMFF